MATRDELLALTDRPLSVRIIDGEHFVEYDDVIKLLAELRTLARAPAPAAHGGEAVGVVAKMASGRLDAALLVSDLPDGALLYTAPQQARADEVPEVLCRECGRPTMHVGSLCFACSKKAKASPEPPTAAECNRDCDCVGECKAGIEQAAAKPAAQGGANPWREVDEAVLRVAGDMRVNLEAAPHVPFPPKQVARWLSELEGSITELSTKED